MQMTHTLKALAAAVTMTFALGAQAAPISSDNFSGGLGTGNGAGSLVLAMFDSGNLKSLVFNTGLTANSFNAQAAGSFDVTIAAADLGALNTFLGGVTNQNAFRWNVLGLTNIPVNTNTGTAYDSVGFLSTAAVGTAITAGPGGNGPNSLAPALRTAMGRANTFFNAQNSATGNPLATGNVVVTNGTAGAAAFNRLGTNLGNSGSFNTSGLLCHSLDFFAYTCKGTATGLYQVKSTQYLGEWKLNFTAGNTSLSYNVAPIPVPAAVWMLGSGIAGLIATRRRKAS